MPRQFSGPGQMSGRHIVIIGATSALGKACAQLWAGEPGNRLTLVARNPEALGLLAEELRKAQPRSRFDIVASDLRNEANFSKMVSQTCSTAPDIVLIALGYYPDQKQCLQDTRLVRRTIEMNATLPSMLAEAFASAMEKNGHGTLGVIGSVSGDRGRRSNYIYGSAKAMLHCYVEGLQHRLGSGPVRVVLIKPGPLNTSKLPAASRRPLVPLADPAAVAWQVVRSIEARVPVVYTPSRWRWIMLLIRLIPGWLFRRLDI